MNLGRSVEISTEPPPTSSAKLLHPIVPPLACPPGPVGHGWVYEGLSQPSHPHLCCQVQDHLQPLAHGHKQRIPWTLSPNSIPRPLLGPVHSPCPPKRSYKFAAGRSSCFQKPGAARGGIPSTGSSSPTAFTLYTAEVDWKHLGWLLSLLPAGSGQSDLQVVVVVPKVTSVQVGAQCQAKDLALRSDPGKVEAIGQ